MSRTISTSSVTPHLRLNPEAGRRIRIYRNGDAHHKGITIVLNARKIHDINAFLDAVSEKIGLVLGAKRLFTLDGTLVTSTEQLEHNKEYVATSGSQFIPLAYGQAPIQSTPNSMRRGSTSTPGNRFARPKEDAFALSSASKKSAPADLTHTPLRQSRSTEPRKGAAVASRLITSTALPKQREKSTGDNSRSEPSNKSLERKKKGTERRDGSKKRGKKKAEEPAIEAPIPPAASPVHVDADEPTKPGEENEVLEESASVHHSPIARTKTEVEVVDHSDHEEVVNEEEADEPEPEELVLENGNRDTETEHHTNKEEEHERPTNLDDADEEVNNDAHDPGNEGKKTKELHEE